jgi:hypothetical protein
MLALINNCKVRDPNLLLLLKVLDWRFSHVAGYKRAKSIQSSLHANDRIASSTDQIEDTLQITPRAGRSNQKVVKK